MALDRRVHKRVAKLIADPLEVLDEADWWFSAAREGVQWAYDNGEWEHDAAFSHTTEILCLWCDAAKTGIDPTPLQELTSALMAIRSPRPKVHGGETEESRQTDRYGPPKTGPELFGLLRSAHHVTKRILDLAYWMTGGRSETGEQEWSAWLTWKKLASVLEVVHVTAKDRCAAAFENREEQSSNKWRLRMSDVSTIKDITPEQIEELRPPRP